MRGGWVMHFLDVQRPCRGATLRTPLGRRTEGVYGNGPTPCGKAIPVADLKKRPRGATTRGLRPDPGRTLMEVSFLLNLGAALLMGVIIGLERQYRQHPAGLRTNALVCVGAALFVSLARLCGNGVSPDHIAGQVVTGVGFLGGGVILREGLNVRGINTAATLWCSAAVGALIGAGYPLYGEVGTLVVLVMNIGLRPITRWMDAHTRKAADVDTSYRVRVVCQTTDVALVRSILMRHVGAHPGLILQGVAVHDADRPDQTAVTVEVFAHSREDRAMEELTSRLNIEPSVSSVRWELAR